MLWRWSWPTRVFAIRNLTRTFTRSVNQNTLELWFCGEWCCECWGLSVRVKSLFCTRKNCDAGGILFASTQANWLTYTEREKKGKNGRKHANRGIKLRSSFLYLVCGTELALNVYADVHPQRTTNTYIEQHPLPSTDETVCGKHLSQGHTCIYRACLRSDSNSAHILNDFCLTGRHNLPIFSHYSLSVAMMEY